MYYTMVAWSAILCSEMCADGINGIVATASWWWNENYYWSCDFLWSDASADGINGIVATASWWWNENYYWSCDFLWSDATRTSTWYKWACRQKIHSTSAPGLLFKFESGVAGERQALHKPLSLHRCTPVEYIFIPWIFLGLWLFGRVRI